MDVTTAPGTVLGACDCLRAEVLTGVAESNILALFGGTSGPGISSSIDSCPVKCGDGTDKVGIISGDRALGDSGCFCRGNFSDLGVALAVFCMAMLAVGGREQLLVHINSVQLYRRRITDSKN
jgi:hypothetical protein